MLRENFFFKVMNDIFQISQNRYSSWFFFKEYYQKKNEYNLSLKKKLNFFFCDMGPDFVISFLIFIQEFPYIYTNVNSMPEDLQHDYYQSAVATDQDQTLSQQTLIIAGVIGGVMLVIIVATIVVSITKKRRLSLNASYQRLW